MDLDASTCYRAVASKDRRFDGMFFTAVRSTGIYCRPSCPARTPKPANVTFHRTAASAQAAGYRACKRCLPGAVPGSPEWDLRADVAGRAMRLIVDGVVEREGVPGLAARLGYTPRHLTRVLVRELGAGPLALARAQRAQNARTLVETTAWRLSDVAFAAGFASVRQFNDTMREVYDASPSELRALAKGGRSGDPAGSAPIEVRLGVRPPYDVPQVAAFVAAHVARGVESWHDGWYSRSLMLPHGPGVVAVDLTGQVDDPSVRVRLRLSDLRDLAAAVERCRRLLDADADPVAVTDALSATPGMHDPVGRHPGLRVPGAVDGDELALRTVLGQQVSLVRANRLAGLLAERWGEPLPDALVDKDVRLLFPSAEALVDVAAEELPMPRSRGRALVALARLLGDGELRLDRSQDREQVRHALLEVPGIGPWTSDYVVMRALGDPDVFLSTDVGALRAARALGVAEDAATFAAAADQWRPWRSYALMHLWATVLPPAPGDPAVAPPTIASSKESCS